MSLGKRQGGLQVQLLHEQRLLLYQLWCALEHLRHLFSNINEIEKWWDFWTFAEEQNERLSNQRGIMMWKIAELRWDLFRQVGWPLCQNIGVILHGLDGLLMG